MTELTDHRGSLQHTHEKALLYVAKSRYKIKRMVKTEVGEFWRDVGVEEIYYYADIIGLEDIGIFSDGWIGWSSNPANPVETGIPAKH